MKRELLLGFFAAITSAAALGGPVSVKSVATLGFADQANILFQENGDAILATPGAKTSDFSNVYVVNTARVKNLSSVTQFGQVLGQGAKFIVMRLDDAERDAVGDVLDGSGNSCGSFFRLMGDKAATVQVNATPIIPVTTELAVIKDAVGGINADYIKATVTELSDLPTRYHSSATGITVAPNLAIEYQKLAAGHDDVSATTFDHGNKTKQNSLIVRIEGTVHPEETIILGSHIDSTSQFGGKAPGADDNASGTATNMEVFRVIMEHNFKFDRTIEIHGYAAEELGLVGSQDVATKYKAAGKKVVAMFQIDMDLYNGNKPDRIWFVTNNTNAALNKDLQTLTDLYVKTPWSAASLSGGSSDHASWNRLGYPAAFPFENPNADNPKIHSANDTIANSGAFTQATAFGRLALSYLAHYAGLVQ